MAEQRCRPDNPIGASSIDDPSHTQHPITYGRARHGSFLTPYPSRSFGTTFLSKRKVEKRFQKHHLEAQRNESPADEIPKPEGCQGRWAVLLTSPTRGRGRDGVGNHPPMRVKKPDGRMGVRRPTHYPSRHFGMGSFLPMDSAPKNSNRIKEGVSFGRCQTHRRLSNDVAAGQSGCKQPLKEDSTRLTQACKKEVSFATFLSKRKVEKRFQKHHLEAQRNESPADDTNNPDGWRGCWVANPMPTHLFGTAIYVPDQRAVTR